MVFEVEYPIPEDTPLLVDEEALKGRSSLCEAVALPKYWTNVRNPNDMTLGNNIGFDQMVYVSQDQYWKFNELLTVSYVAKATQDRVCPRGTCPRTPGGCKCVQPDGYPGLPSEYFVRRVIRVEDSEMWTRYEKKREKIRTLRGQEHIPDFDPPAVTDEIADTYTDIFEPLDGDLNEVYLWHGTAVRRALSIAQEDFKIDLAGTSRGTMYGAGAYMAESSTKADEYAKDEPGGYYEGVYALLLCRVVMGKYYYTNDRDEEAVEKVKAGEFDSTLGDRAKTVGTFREFVVYDADQIYPEYVVLYSRIHKGDAEAHKEALRNSPELHMELPVYWANCHKDPHKEAFHAQFKVRASTMRLLRKLVAASFSDETKTVVITKARRIENSDIWNSYTQYKQERRREIARRRDVEEGFVSFTPVEMLDGNEEDGHVLTLRHLQGEGLEECISVSNLELAMNELMLWHGTTKTAAETIIRTDFVIPRGSQVKHGSRFGNGAYFAEDIAKSLHYAPEEGGSKTVLLCRVVCGDIYYTEESVEQDAVDKCARQGKHSVLANPIDKTLSKKFQSREFIVSNATQVYPEYILDIEEVVKSESE